MWFHWMCEICKYPYLKFKHIPSIPSTQLSVSGHYQSRAMPSAGIAPFLQTYVCNMDNQCHDDESLKHAQETTYRLVCTEPLHCRVVV